MNVRLATTKERKTQNAVNSRRDILACESARRIAGRRKLEGTGSPRFHPQQEMYRERAWPWTGYMMVGGPPGAGLCTEGLPKVMDGGNGRERIYGLGNGG